MIKAELTRHAEGGRILVVGHAPRPPGAEKTGNLVCAAASFLTCVTAQSLEAIAGATVEDKTGDYESASGYVEFSWSGGGEKAETIAEEWMYGMRRLAEDYPGAAEITVK